MFKVTKPAFFILANVIFFLVYCVAFGLYWVLLYL